jgi:hypothetical protein
LSRLPAGFLAIVVDNGSAGMARVHGAPGTGSVHGTARANGQVRRGHTPRAHGRTITTEISMFGRLSADGRLQHVDQITRDLTPGR